MTIEQKPDALSFSGNIKDLVLEGVEGSISFTLHQGDAVILTETYAAAPDRRVTVPLRDILESQVQCPACEVGAVEIPEYSIIFDGMVEIFRVIKGGHAANVSAATFCRANFLTWQPQTRYTMSHTPQYLRYVALAAATCKVKAYFADGSAQTVDHSELAADRIHTMDVSFGAIRPLFAAQPVYYDVWVETMNGLVKTWTQRYILAGALPGVEDIFMFENSLGGFDTVRFSGDRKEVNDVESVYALFGEETIEYDIDGIRSWQKFTGYIEMETDRLWTLDFFNSTNRYHLADGVLHRIYVSKPKLESTAGETTGYEFTFARAVQSKYLSLPRTEIPELLEIISPDDEVFFLAPRLNEFEWTGLTDDVLIPVQRQHSKKWFALPGVLIRQIADGFGTAIEGLAEIFHPKGGRPSLDMKAKDVTAAGTTTVRDLVVGGDSRSEEFTEGQTGQGWRIDSGGHAELESLVLRRFLEVPELRYNRVDINIGDKWRAPGGGIIESVDRENMVITLKLEEGEIGAVKAGDICMGMWHDRRSPEFNAAADSDDGRGNRTFAGFCTVYFAVEEVLDARNRQFRYRLRETGETYPRQYHPAEMMHFVGYGSFTDPARREAVYETRGYIRMLVDVDDWEFTARNIGAQFGDCSNLAVHGLEMEGRSIYLDNVYMRGVVKQFNEDGTPIDGPLSPAGPWSPEGAPYKKNSLVSLAGSQFLALRDTSEPPMGLLKSGDSYLVSGGSYLPRGPVEDFLNDDWEVFLRRAADGDDGRPGDWTAYAFKKSDVRPATPDSTKPVPEGWSAEPGDDGVWWMSKAAVDGATGRAGEWSVPIRITGADGKPGDNGLSGLIYRPITEWATGFEYRNDEALQVDLRYCDIVVVTSGASQRKFKCMRTHVSTSATKPPNANFWQELNDMHPIYTSLLVAPNAMINFMQGQQLLIHDPAGNVVAGMSAAGNYPLWAGGGDPSKAPLRYDRVNRLLTVEGIVNAIGGILRNVTVATNPNGLRMELDSATRSLKMYDSTGDVVGEWYFTETGSTIKLTRQAGDSAGSTTSLSGGRLTMQGQTAVGSPTMTEITGTSIHYSLANGDGGFSAFTVQERVSGTAGKILQFRIRGLPTSPTGLISGEMWRDGTTLKIV